MPQNVPRFVNSPFRNGRESSHSLQVNTLCESLLHPSCTISRCEGSNFSKLLEQTYTNQLDVFVADNLTIQTIWRCKRFGGADDLAMQTIWCCRRFYSRDGFKKQSASRRHEDGNPVTERSFRSTVCAQLCLSHRPVVQQPRGTATRERVTRGALLTEKTHPLTRMTLQRLRAAVRLVHRHKAASSTDKSNWHGRRTDPAIANSAETKTLRR